MFFRFIVVFFQCLMGSSWPLDECQVREGPVASGEWSTDLRPLATCRLRLAKARRRVPPLLGERESLWMAIESSGVFRASTAVSSFVEKAVRQPTDPAPPKRGDRSPLSPGERESAWVASLN
jgi:hypothetical protein